MKLPLLGNRDFDSNRRRTLPRDRERHRRRFGLEELEGRQLLATIGVQNPADSGPGTLRDAIQRANANPAVTDIVLDLEGTIGLASALPTLTGNYKIEGPGANQLTIDREQGPEFRIFAVGPQANIEIDGVTLSGGQAPEVSPGISYGGAIQNVGKLTLNAVDVRGNVAISFGAGIYNQGALTIIDSTLHGNALSAGEGGAYYGGPGSTLYMSNSTVASNFSGGLGGGVVVATNASATIVDSTIAFNQSDSGAPSAAEPTGAGLRVQDYGGEQGDVQLFDTLIGDNTDGTSNTPDDVRGPIDGASRFNLIGIGDAVSGLADQSGGNKIGTIGNDGSHYFIGLAPLDYNGGPTPTCALTMVSDAIDAGSNDYADPQTTDQTGRNRIVNGTIDIGAYEFQPSGVYITLNVSPAPVTGQPLTLTATVTPATPGSNPVTGIVTFYYNDYDPGTFLKQVGIVDGKAVLSGVTLPAGTQIVAAQYEGDSEYSGTNTQLDVTPGNAAGGTATTMAITTAPVASSLNGTSTGTGTGDVNNVATSTSAPGGTTPSASSGSTGSTTASQAQGIVATVGHHAPKRLAQHVSHPVLHGHPHPRPPKR
jgi:hypothetical protein